MKKNRLIAVLSTICILSLSMMVLALGRDQPQVAFTPPPFEPDAVTGEPPMPVHRGYQELDAQVFRVGLCGEVTVAEGRAQVWLYNPEENSVWLKLRVLDEAGNILGQTGLLRPGEYVRQVNLTDGTPGMSIILKVMAYEPRTYHSAGALNVHTVLTAE